jgi:hypothetical protein
MAELLEESRLGREGYRCKSYRRALCIFVGRDEHKG